MATERADFHKKMLILMAVPQESQGLIEPWAKHRQIPLIFTGMGLVNAAAKTAEAIVKYQPEWILNLGTGGSRKFTAGTVVECIEFNRRDHPISFLNKKIKIPSQTQLQTTNCGSADFVDVTDQVEQFGIVDMEAYAIASVCQNFKIKMTCVKSVSDDSTGTPDLKKVKSDWEKNLNICSKNLFEFLQQVEKF